MMSQNDPIEDTLVSVMLRDHRGFITGDVLHLLPGALAILAAYGVCSPERVFFFRSQDYDELQALGLHPPFVEKLRRWQGLMMDTPPPPFKKLQDCALYSPEALYLCGPAEYERWEREGIDPDTIAKLKRWQKHMIDNPAPLDVSAVLGGFTTETWLEIQLESKTIVPVTTSPYRIGRDENKEHIDLHFSSTLVSRSHCLIRGTMIPGKVAVLTDTSTNGTSVNGQRMTKGSKQLLEHGDKVGIGISGDFTSNTFTVLDPTQDK